MDEPRIVPEWKDYFFQLAQLVKTKSKDRSTQVGVVITSPSNHIVATGYNGFPHGVDDNCEKYHERPTKYLITEHAERNAIYYCARKGISLEGCIMYFDSSPFPCSDCARGVIQAGITTVVGRDVCFAGKGEWLSSIYYGKKMMMESGIEIVIYDDNGCRVPVDKAKQFQDYVV